ncbi:hypothetical protein HanRHA438_Chr02g0082491 [Helianthus annuus]|nr:hypothetical protein HanRHA438_Chr02g0082491 [Helianthus annuus]
MNNSARNTNKISPEITGNWFGLKKVPGVCDHHRRFACLGCVLLRLKVPNVLYLWWQEVRNKRLLV